MRYAWHLTQELVPAGRAAQLAGLVDAIAWCRFRADWVARTGMRPLSDVQPMSWDGVGVRLSRHLDRGEDVPGLLALQRSGERVLRCCRVAVWYWSTDELRWPVAAMLLGQGWHGGELDLLAAVNGIAAGQ